MSNNSEPFDFEFIDIDNFCNYNMIVRGKKEKYVKFLDYIKDNFNISYLKGLDYNYNTDDMFKGEWFYRIRADEETVEKILNKGSKKRSLSVEINKKE